MTTRTTPRRLVALLLAVVLAGCFDAGPTPPPPADTAPASQAPTDTLGQATPAPSDALAQVTPAPSAALELPPWDELDTRWGTYVSEREWGNPRESQLGNGWGMSVLEATRQDYRFAEDGIAAVSDDEGQFHLGWAFWDGEAVLVTERLFGLTNPQGAHGETLIDRRTFGANTPTHSYADYRLSLPRPGLAIQEPGARPDPPPTWDVRLESARADDDRLVMRATLANIGEVEATLHVVLKGWFGADDTGTVTAMPDGLVLDGGTAVVAVAAEPATGVQASDEKRSLDEHLRGGGLAGPSTGRIGALAYAVTLPPGGARSLAFAAAEVHDATGGAPAIDAARRLLGSADAVIRERGDEAATLFRDDVTAHRDLYAAALSGLLWAKSYYAWDGSGLDDAWAGRVDVHDVLVMPDKWEYPWVASWDTAFHAVTATLIDPDLAADQLRFLFSDRWQQPDGHVPCAEWVMAVECPPLFGWAALRVAAAYDEAGRVADGDAFLEALYPGLVRQYRHWQAANAVGGDLYAGGFLGMDNLPRGEPETPDGEPPAQADGSAWMAAFAGHLAAIAERIGAREDVDGFRADRARVAAAVNARLWDEEDGFYHDADAGGLLGDESYSGLVPLIAGIVPRDRLPRVLEAIRDPNRLLADGGLRSLSARSFSYLPGVAGRGVNSNWRGPVWLPYTYLVIEALRDVDPALADDLADRTIAMVEADWTATGRFHEFYHGSRGTGLGADAQTGWTALVANLIAERHPAP